MSNFSYFKLTFIAIFSGIFIGVIVYQLFDVDFSNNEALVNVLKKAFFVAFFVALFMGILNMIFKVGNFKEKQK